MSKIISEIENKAVEIYKGRRAKLEKIKKEKEEKGKLYERRINHAAKMLLGVFEASNKEETEAQVWQVKLTLSGKSMLCGVAFSTADDAQFYIAKDGYLKAYADSQNIQFKSLEAAINIVDGMTISKEEIKDIEFVLRNNTPEYFHLFRTEGSLIILMDTPKI